MNLSHSIPMHLCTVLFHILEVSCKGHRILLGLELEVGCL